MVSEKENKLLGVSALLKVDHSIVLMPLFTGENTRKGDEWVGEDRWQLSAGQLEVVSGRCKSELGETLVGALKREAEEERGISNIDTSRLLDGTLRVGQERNGVPVEFLVHLFISQLNQEQLSDLRQHHEAEVVSEAQLSTFMQERGRIGFRPSVWALLQLTCDNNFWRN